MCGICGVVDTGAGPVDRDLLRRMNTALAHRGPDDEGYHVADTGHGASVGLAMRRLSIIDLAGGHQPISNEDGSVWIVFNGEIYNYRELRAALETRGHIFTTTTDTEVIVHLYEDKGVDCLADLRGMFAFAIWDAARERLFVARDRVGKKPLVYAVAADTLLFASEIKALLQHPAVAREIDAVALHHYLSFQYIPSPQTVFTSIRKLPPASYLTFSRAGGLSVHRYWNLCFTPKLRAPEGELIERTRDLLAEATALRLRSDVPVGAFLSGGLDSSIVVGLMCRASSATVRTFSIGFNERDFSELEYARQVAQHFGTRHEEFIVTPDLVKTLPEIAHFYDEPFADYSALPTYYVAKLAREHVKVALNGDGGDENFAGYGHYRDPLYLRTRMARLAPLSLRRLALSVYQLLPPRLAGKFGRRVGGFLERTAKTPFESNHDTISLFSDAEKSGLYTAEFARQVAGVSSFESQRCHYEGSGSGDLIDQLLYTDIMTYLPDDLLVKMDIATMAHSLEVRSPFLDHVFMEFAAALPARLKLRNLESKYLLKRAFRGFVPDAILQRPKQGFSIPIDRWFRVELKAYAQEVLLDPRSLRRGYFQPASLEKLLGDHSAGLRNAGHRIWGLVMLELWHRNYADG